ncbi:uncharacterized protein CMU_034400 [Cryptosporidium muris RN66]|uniref:Transmembrane protein n=1 Tax=Cryptosporidium muris (strain RN66) TaxID=441375 RepID=B6AFR3_CRYMR|nr:uncharacterized protein CMU_034400 [Cryptosporidium muris RN66]EEA07054.1 hypothetical protein, conserved [Cryptosporidium muris RN66]|eukprot:XP_002141403.1 hypothetical protein [Cryptosporidium muris RN66]
MSGENLKMIHHNTPHFNGAGGKVKRSPTAVFTNKGINASKIKKDNHKHNVHFEHSNGDKKKLNGSKEHHNKGNHHECIKSNNEPNNVTEDPINHHIVVHSDHKESEQSSQKKVNEENSHTKKSKKSFTKIQRFQMAFLGSLVAANVVVFTAAFCLPVSYFPI